MKKAVLLIMMLFFSGVSQASTPILVSTPPVVAITSPANRSTFTTGSDITITATASETGGTIPSVSFYNGPTLLGQSRKSPYSYTWRAVGVGRYTLTAVATVKGVSKASRAVTVTVTPAPPVVAITSPANDAVFTEGSNVNLVARGSEINGTISIVSFYKGSTLLTKKSMTSPSCHYTWANVPAGTHTLTAVAKDTHGVSATSSPITVMVASSSEPVIAITSPANRSTFTKGSNITITASVLETNGTIREVFFYDSTEYLASTTVSPYTYTWTNVPAGTYSLIVEATDNKGRTLISDPVNITVNSTK